MYMSHEIKQYIVSITVLVAILVVFGSIIALVPGTGGGNSKESRSDSLLRSYNSNDLNIALETADSLLKESPEDGKTLLIKAQILLQKGTVEFDEETFSQKARPIIEEVLSRSDISPEVEAFAYHSLGYSYEIERRYEDALSVYTEGLSLFPEDPNLLAQKGHVYDLQGDMDKAEEFYIQALATDPVHGKANAHMGSLLFRKGQAEEARTYLQTALEEVHSDVTLAGVYHSLALVERVTGNPSRAEELFDKAISIDSKNPLYYITRGNHAIIKELIDARETGEFSEPVNARKDLMKAIELHSESAESYYWLGVLEGTLGEFSQAEEYLMRAQALIDDDISLLGGQREELKVKIKTAIEQNKSVQEEENGRSVSFSPIQRVLLGDVAHAGTVEGSFDNWYDTLCGSGGEYAHAGCWTSGNTIYCYNDHSTTVISSPPPPPETKVNISASPNPVEYDTKTKISWSTSHASSCSTSGGSEGWDSVNPDPDGGSWNSSNLAPSPSESYPYNITYSIQCQRDGGGGRKSDSDSVTVQVREPKQCQDGSDNDGDGQVDLNDPQCAYGPTDDSEDVRECSDGIDNDGDGWVDYPNDPGCDSYDDDSEFNESTGKQCSDGVDNDREIDIRAHGEGLLDGYDVGCLNSNDEDETEAPDFSLTKTNNLEVTIVGESPSGSNETTVSTDVSESFTSDITLSAIQVSPDIPGISYTWAEDDNTLTWGEYSNKEGDEMSVTVPGSTSSGEYIITVQGEGGGLTRTIDILLRVKSSDPQFENF